MPIHDWSRVEAGVFHAFHHDWITEKGNCGDIHSGGKRSSAISVSRSATRKG
jgi:hypothetical protein